MTDDYKEGFASGFDLGFKRGLEEGKRQGLIEGMKQTLPPPYVPQPNLNGIESCPKCGVKISGVTGYVCSSLNCPVFYQLTS